MEGLARILHERPGSVQREDVTAILVHQFQRAAAAPRHAGQWIVGDEHRQPSLLADQAVHAPEQGAAAGEHDAGFHHVRAQFGGRLLQRGLDRVEDSYNFV